MSQVNKHENNKKTKKSLKDAISFQSKKEKFLCKLTVAVLAGDEDVTVVGLELVNGVGGGHLRQGMHPATFVQLDLEIIKVLKTFRGG